MHGVSFGKEKIVEIINANKGQRQEKCTSSRILSYSCAALCILVKKDSEINKIPKAKHTAKINYICEKPIMPSTLDIYISYTRLKLGNKARDRLYSLLSRPGQQRELELEH